MMRRERFIQARPRATTPAAMNDEIQQRVETFVQEILSLVERAREESRAAALDRVTIMLAGMERPSTAKSDTREATGAKGATRARRALEAAPAVQQSRVPEAAVIPSSPASASNGTRGPSSEREALVLDAVRSLARATATEIAGRCGQPNGSVAVVLRALVARGLVAKAETPRGVEYSSNDRVPPRARGPAGPLKPSPVAAPRG
jgi:hypothetical protein